MGSDLEAELAELRLAFVRRLPGQLARFESLLEASSLAELEREVHSLAGSAGSFGYPDIGRAARGLEDLLRQGCQADEDDHRWRAQLLSQLGSLLRVARGQTATPSG